jgi:hypothetical protein
MANAVQPAALGAVPTRVDVAAYVLRFGRICFATDFMLLGARKFAAN